jgi:hypothetical protein
VIAPIDGLEALAYHWTPELGRAIEINEFVG